MFEIIGSIIIIGYFIVKIYADIHMSDKDRREKDAELWTNYRKDLARIKAL